MSCSRNNDTVSRTGSLKAGISQLGSKAGSFTGQIASRLEQASDAASDAVGSRVAPLSNRVLKSIDRPTTVAANLVPAAVTAAVYTQVRVSTTGPRQGRRPAVAVAVGMREVPDLLERARLASRVKKGVGLAALAGGLSAAIAADLTEQPWGQRKLVQRKKSFLLGERKVDVSFTKSKLTRFLNRRELLVSPGKVVASWGDMVHYGSSTWHRGTTIVKTGQGKRTITHLRRLGLPASSHYFERRLSAAEVASIVSGQRQPHHLSGHVGTIGAMENLAPSWSQMKRALILTRLHWPTKARAPRWEQEPDGEAVKPTVIKRPPVPARQRTG